MTDTVKEKYFPTIGLEIHAELDTKTKMFCNSKNDPDETRPNVNVCPICMAHPGTLPTINKKAIEHMVRIGLAVGGEIANFTEFDRKNYFYPDIPKGFQISQYKYPIVSGGSVAGFELERIHLEEDTGTNKHDQGNFSLVDYNRAGIPLMELVTKPVLHSAEDAVMFAKELQQILRYLGVAHANMEKGEMRVEANISISPKKDVLGTKVEIKNLNSFKVVEKAVAYEINRMIDLHEAGRAGEIVQETRGWDEAKGVTFSQRKKENSHDYRYFPEPDLPKMYLHEIFDLETMKGELPELPHERRTRYAEMFGIKDEDIEGYINDRDLAVFFENVAILCEGDKELLKKVSNYITSDIVGLMKTENMTALDIHDKLIPADFAKLITMSHEGTITSRATKDLLKMMIDDGGNPEELAEKHGMIQQNDKEALKKIAQTLINEHPAVADDVRAGKEKAIKFLVGQGMKATKGSANPQVLEKILQELLS